MCSKQKRILHYSNYIEKKQPIHPATYYHIKYIINYTYSYPYYPIYTLFIYAPAQPTKLSFTNTN